MKTLRAITSTAILALLVGTGVPGYSQKNDDEERQRQDKAEKRDQGRKQSHADRRAQGQAQQAQRDQQRRAEQERFDRGRARQQQQEAQRQEREQERMDRDRARQQQQEADRQQREQERIQRDQERQQQQEAQRQQREQERFDRDRARQQQQEAQRQEREQERMDRDRARQQQQQAERQQREQERIQREQERRQPADQADQRQRERDRDLQAREERSPDRQFGRPDDPSPRRPEEWMQLDRQRRDQFRQRVEREQPVVQQQVATLQREGRRQQYNVQLAYWNNMRRQRERYWRDWDRGQYRNRYIYVYPNYRYTRFGVTYYTSDYGVGLIRQALNDGYEQGFYAGRADRLDGWRFDYDDCWAYRDANYGYYGFYINQSEYNYYFRQGFRRGYQDGYYGYDRYGYYGGGRYHLLDSVLSGIFVSIRIH